MFWCFPVLTVSKFPATCVSCCHCAPQATEHYFLFVQQPFMYLKFMVAVSVLIPFLVKSFFVFLQRCCLLQLLLFYNSLLPHALTNVRKSQSSSHGLGAVL